MKGTGQLLLTGQLGEVMQESAKIALSLLKSRLPLQDPLLDFSKKDIHVHVPAGAIPKAGDDWRDFPPRQRASRWWH